MARPNPDRVHPRVAEDALQEANGDRQLAWTKYILLHFRGTRKLAPGCDMRDLIAWYEQNVSAKS